MQNDLTRLHGEFCLDMEFRNYRPRTIQWHRGALRLFMRHSDGEVRSVHDLTTERLRRYLYERRLGGWKATTFLAQYKGLKAFLKWCVKRKILESNPIDAIERPRLEKSLPRRISEQDAQRVLDHAFHAPTSYRFQRYRDRAVLGVMIYAGLRATEALSLKLGHLDMENAMIFVQSGKGGKDRMVPMSATLRRWLKEYLDDRKRLRKNSEHFFVSLRGETRFTCRGLTRMVTRIKKGTGIDFSRTSSVTPSRR